MLLLLFSIAPVLSAPQVLSQTFTTVTSVATNRLTYTNAQTTAVSSNTETTTTRSIASYMWTEAGIGSYNCNLDWFSFYATAGQSVGGNIAADQPYSMTIYILSDQQFTAWRQSKWCDPQTPPGTGSEWSAGSDTDHITQTEVQWTPKTSGKYWVLVETYSNKDVVVTARLSTQNPQTTTIILYATSFSTTVYSLTQTLTSVIVQQPPTSSPSGLLGIPGFQFEAIILGALLGFGLLLIRHKSNLHHENQ